MDSVKIELDPELARALDELRRRRGYEDRGSAVQDVLRTHLAGLEAESAAPRGERLATCTFFHSPGDRESAVRIARLKADRGWTVGELGRDLPDGSRFECLLLLGPAGELQAFVDALTAIRGVRRARYDAHPAPKPPPH